MIYSLTKPIAKVALATYFRKVYFSNQDVIPKGKPVILAANHPSALIEPCLLACWLDRPLSYIARGDIYLNSFWVRTLYRMYNMVPVFRMQDAGYGHIKDNYESFEKCFDALNDNRVLMILAEGKTIHEKRMRPIMKGTARIIFGAMEKYGDLNIHVVPTGINYSNPDQFRSIAMVDFGEPIRVREYYELYKEQPAKAIQNVTKEISKRLKERVIHINDKGDDELVERLFEIRRNDKKAPLFPITITNKSTLFSEKQLADSINGLSEFDKKNLKEKVTRYYALLGLNGTSDLGMAHRTSYSWANSIFLAIGWLPAIMGQLLNWPPLLVGNKIADKMAPSIEFRASIAGVFGSLLWLFYFAIIVLGLGLSGVPKLAFTAFLLPALGYFSILYREGYDKWREAKKTSALAPIVFVELKEYRDEISRFIEDSSDKKN